MSFLINAKNRSRTDRVIVFTRYPEAGKTKTRLITELGAEGAAKLQRGMAEHALGRVRELTKARPISVEVRYQGGMYVSYETMVRRGCALSGTKWERSG